MHDGEPRSAEPLTWLAAASVAAFAAATAHVGADARWLAAMGHAITEARRLPTGVVYAAAPSHWHDAPALGQLLFSLLERGLGDPGLLAANAVAVAIAVAALAVDCRRADARDGTAAAVLVAVLLGAPAALLVVRAQLFTVAFLPVLLLLLRREAGWRSKRIWLVVPLLALWANLHGGVLIGFAVTAAYLLLDRARRAPGESVAALAASAAALFATPALLRSGSYYLSVLHGETAASHYGLWAHLSPADPLDLLLLAVGAAFLVGAIRTRPPAWEIALLLAFAALTVDARRNGICLLLFAAPRAARALGQRRAAYGIVSGRLAGVCLAAVAVVGLGGVAYPRPADGATDALLVRARVAAEGTPILADPLDAEQLALAGARVWIANPLDAFSPADQRRYLEWVGGRGDANLLRRARPRVVVVARGSEPDRRLAARTSYRVLARDAHAVVYTAR